MAMLRPMGRRTVRRAVVIACGLVLGIALVGLTFFRLTLDGGPRLVPRFDLGDWARDLPSHAGWLVPYVVLTAALPALRALVWGALLPAPRPPPVATYHAVAIGGLVHNALPGKMGPLASAWLLARWGSASFGALLGALLLAKLLELGGVVVMTVASAAAVASLGGALRGIILSGVGAFALLALLALFLQRAARADRPVRQGRLARAFAAFREGLATLRSPRALAPASALALVPALVCALAYGLALQRFAVPGGWLGGGVLLGVITFGQFTPALPVGMGVYYFLCAWGARQLGASDGDAASLAVLSHLATVLTHLGVGLVSAVLHRGGLREVLRMRRASRGGAPVPLDAGEAGETV